MKKNELLSILCSNYSFVRKSVRISGINESDVDDVCEEVMVAAVRSVRKLKQEVESQGDIEYYQSRGRQGNRPL